MGAPIVDRQDDEDLNLDMAIDLKALKKKKQTKLLQERQEKNRLIREEQEKIQKEIDDKKRLEEEKIRK